MASKSPSAETELRHAIALVALALLIASPVAGIVTKSWWAGFAILSLGIMLIAVASILAPSER